MVLYIPNPIIIAAKVAKGTKMKKFAFLPMGYNQNVAYKIVTVLFHCNSKHAHSIRVL